MSKSFRVRVTTTKDYDEYDAYSIVYEVEGAFVRTTEAGVIPEHGYMFPYVNLVSVEW